MNTNEMLLWINGTIDWVRAVDAAAQQLPAKHRKALTGISWAGDVVTRLEMVAAAMKEQASSEKDARQ